MCVIFQVDRKTWLVTDELRESPTDGLTNWLRLGDVVYTPTERALCLTIFFFLPPEVPFDVRLSIHRLRLLEKANTWRVLFIWKSSFINILFFDIDEREREGPSIPIQLGSNVYVDDCHGKKWTSDSRRFAVFVSSIHTLSHTDTQEMEEIYDKNHRSVFVLERGEKKEEIPVVVSAIQKFFYIVCPCQNGQQILHQTRTVKLALLLLSSVLSTGKWNLVRTTSP